jgi:hypothetical protein
MDEIRISFNPDNNIFLYSNSGELHADTIHKAGHGKNFDEFIRAIYKNKILYIRIYYPYNDIDNLNMQELTAKSFDLIYNNKKELIKRIKKELKLIIKDIKYNVTNDILQGVLVNI